MGTGLGSGAGRPGPVGPPPYTPCHRHPGDCSPGWLGVMKMMDGPSWKVRGKDGSGLPAHGCPNGRRGKAAGHPFYGDHPCTGADPPSWGQSAAHPYLQGCHLPMGGQ